MAASNTCRCGHRRDAHQHYRAGTDCSLCGATVCARFRSTARWPRRLIGALRGDQDQAGGTRRLLTPTLTLVGT